MLGLVHRRQHLGNLNRQSWPGIIFMGHFGLIPILAGVFPRHNLFPNQEVRTQCELVC